MIENPYMKASIVAFLSAVLTTLYTKYADPEEKKLASKFAQVFIAVMMAGIALIFVTNGSSGEDLVTLPFENGGLADF